MQLTGSKAILVVSANRKHTVELRKQLPDGSDWKPTTRISTLWKTKPYSKVPNEHENFAGKSHLFFAGPLHPEIFQNLLQNKNIDRQLATVWLTLGIKNICCQVFSPKVASMLRKWLTQNEVKFECWRIEDQTVLATDSNADTETFVSEKVVKELKKLKIDESAIELRSSLEEFKVLVLQTLVRSNQVTPELSSKFELICENVVRLIQYNNRVHSHDTLYDSLGSLTYINAGLSRYLSQAYAGISPIYETECHFWTESLLGTGTANLALEKITVFVLKTLGYKRIPQRLKMLEGVPYTQKGLQELSFSDPFLEENHIGAIELPVDEIDETIYPQITYFSARDGFKGHLLTLSAPLTSITCCNSERWCLLTLTHEISHIFIRGVLSEIYPDANNDKSIANAKKVVCNDPDNLLDALRQLVIHSVVAMQSVNDNSSTTQNDTKEDGFPIPSPQSAEFEPYLQQALVNWKPEIDELMTHIFDFIYFYNKNPERYIRELWLSWSVIPNVHEKVSEYVVRTICAILLVNAHRPKDMYELARTSVIDVLEKVHDKSPNDLYLSQAIFLLKENWDSIKNQITCRAGLVKAVQIGCFSEEFSDELWRDTALNTSSASTSGYNSRVGEFNLDEIENPLRWLDKHTKSIEPKASTSFWILNSLAFNTGDLKLDVD